MRARWIAASLAILLALGGIALGHARLRVNESVPAPGALLAESPKEIKLVFSVEPGASIPLGASSGWSSKAPTKSSPWARWT
jgi:methionine-rich copper-binding protein CopC